MNGSGLGENFINSHFWWYFTTVINNIFKKTLCHGYLHCKQYLLICEMKKFFLEVNSEKWFNIINNKQLLPCQCSVFHFSETGHQMSFWLEAKFKLLSPLKMPPNVFPPLHCGHTLLFSKYFLKLLYAIDSLETL